MKEGLEGVANTISMRKWVKVCIGFCVIVFLITTALFFYNELRDISETNKINHEKFSSYATFLSGICGVGISLLTLYLVFETFKSQQKELQDTARALLSTEHTNKIQQFESAFFQMLSNHSRIIKSYDYIKTGISNDYIPEWGMNGKTGVDLLNYLYQCTYAKTQLRFEALLKHEFKKWDEFTYTPILDTARRIDIVRFVVKDILTIFQFIIEHEKGDFENKINWNIYKEILLNTLYDSEKFFFTSYHHLVNSTYYKELDPFIEHYKNQFINGSELDRLKEPIPFTFCFINSDRFDNTRFKQFQNLQWAENYLQLRIDCINSVKAVPRNARFVYETATINSPLEIKLGDSPGMEYYVIDFTKSFHEILNIAKKSGYYHTDDFSEFFNRPSMNLMRIEFDTHYTNYTYRFSIPITLSWSGSFPDEMIFQIDKS